MRVLALLVMVVGFLVVWGGFTHPDPELEYCPLADETTTVSLASQWWPPGTLRCDVTRDDELVATRTTFPAREYLTVVLFGLAVAVLALHPRRLLASLGLLLAGVAVFFGFDG
jgi:hypothetical protein